jgi:hypothetical protein
MGSIVMRARNILFVALVATMLPAFADNRIRIADEGKIGDAWSPVPATQLMPPYPDQYAKDPEEVCLVVGYLVNADGTTSDFSLLKSWASGSNSRSRKDFWTAFADLASRALAQWKYTPKDPATAKPVYTAATFVFGKPASAAETKTHCEVSDLTERLAELRYNGRAGRMMAKGIYSKLDIDPGVEERMRQRSVTWKEETDQGQAAHNTANERVAESNMGSNKN